MFEELKLKIKDGGNNWLFLTTRVVIDSYKKFYPLIPSKVTFVTALREHLLQHKGNLSGNIYSTKVPSNCKGIVI